MKDSFYFPHDYHARHDPKLVALIKIHGMTGYGVYWNLVEILHEHGGKIEKFPKLLEGLASEMKQNEATLKVLLACFVDDLCLLKEDKTHIWSDRVLQNFQDREEKRLQKVASGRLGGIISGRKRSKTKHTSSTNEANEAKERKGKERKVFIAPTLEEVKIYCDERNNGINPQIFLDHYGAADWFRGKTKIVDWKACIRTWEQKNNKPKHPFATKDGYVLEHRLAVEKEIGRFLTPAEHVHHINKIKDDNRPQNLMAFKSNKVHKHFEAGRKIELSDVIFDGRKI